MGNSQIDPSKIYMKADGFSAAHDLLARAEVPIHVRMLTGTAGIVLSALACELFLKCLVLIETGKLERGHHLKHLFDRLEMNTKRSIRSIWDAEIVPRQKLLWDAFERETGSKISRDLPTALSRSKGAFEKLRYSYEGDVENIDYVLNELPWILKRVILARHPEWKQLRHVIQDGLLDPTKASNP